MQDIIPGVPRVGSLEGESVGNKVGSSIKYVGAANAEMDVISRENMFKLEVSGAQAVFANSQKVGDSVGESVGNREGDTVGRSLHR